MQTKKILERLQAAMEDYAKSEKEIYACLFEGVNWHKPCACKRVRNYENSVCLISYADMEISRYCLECGGYRKKG